MTFHDLHSKCNVLFDALQHGEDHQTMNTRILVEGIPDDAGYQLYIFVYDNELEGHIVLVALADEAAAAAGHPDVFFQACFVNDFINIGQLSEVSVDAKLEDDIARTMGTPEGPFLLFDTVTYGSFSNAASTSVGFIKGRYNRVLNNCASRLIEISNLLGYGESSASFDALTDYLVERFVALGFGRRLLDDPGDLAVLFTSPDARETVTERVVRTQPKCCLGDHEHL